MTLLSNILDRLSRIEQLPDHIVNIAILHLIDTLGVGHAAAGSKVAEPWKNHGTAVSTGGLASIFGQSQGSSPANAALVNGGFIHSLEYDDTHTGSIVHGSAVLVPVALAAAESAGASGSEMIRAYVLWYEVMIRIGLAASGGFQNLGFQLTSVGGTLCAAGVAAQLYSLKHLGRMAAIGIALSQSSGVFEFLSNGSTVKSMHPGWAAHSGIIAAELAAAGLTGPETAIEGRFGLFKVFAGDALAAEKLEDLLGDFGHVWHLEATAYKFHPCCHYLHPFIEAVAMLMNKGVTQSTLKTIEFFVPPGEAQIICEPWDLKCSALGHAARWSLPIVAGMQIVDGIITLDSFEKTPSEAVMAIAARRNWHPLKSSHFPKYFEAVVKVTLHDGSIFEQRVDDVYGNASRPASEADVINKFTNNISIIADEKAAFNLREALWELPKAPNTKTLSAALKAIGRNNIS